MRYRLIAIVIGGLLAGALAAVLALPGVLERILGEREVRSLGKALVGGPFSLVDHTGKAVSDKDFRGRHMLVFFGFTFCPDVCPSGLQVMAAALDRLGPKADRIQPIFITIDPERDRPEQLASYVASFHPRLVGLTGSLEAVTAAAKAYRVYFKKAKDESSTAEYTFDHTSFIYLMDAKGEYVAHFTHATSPEVIAERLRKVL
jgi:protein SCO1/2